MQQIKNYSKSQLILLRNMNYLLGKCRIPREVLKRAEYALEHCKTDGHSFVIIILNPVRDDTCEIEDLLSTDYLFGVNIFVQMQ